MVSSRNSNQDIPATKQWSNENQVAFDQVITVCREFDAAWQTGQQPRLPSFLPEGLDQDEEALLRNLIRIDIEHRKRIGQEPKVGDYVQKFPEHVGLIRRVFLASATESLSIAETMDETSCPDDDEHQPASTILRLPAALQLGDYQLVREVGQGGMGVVYEAVRSGSTSRVALKLLPKIDGERLHRFKREFRLLSDVNHPNLVRLHTLECDGTQWFITMDLISGVDFMTYVRPGGVLDEVRFRSAVAQLVKAVMAIHAEHIVHRDLKPSNIMVDDEGQLFVLDFGLVANLGPNDRSMFASQISGTPAYMAPEQARGEEPRSSTDWYSVGVILYQALMGQLPFSGTMMQVLNDKQNREPPGIRTSSELETYGELTMKLLKIDPDERADILAISGVVSSTDIESLSSSSMSHHELVGRDHQLAALHQLVESSQQSGKSSFVFVSGRSGEGKSSLCDAFLRSSILRSAIVLSAKCYDRESVPFKALDSLIDALASHLRTLTDEDAAMLMPRDVRLLAKIFPVFQRIKVVTKAPEIRTENLDDQQVRTRAFSALRELIVRMSDRNLVVMMIDDLQWGDADSAEALFEVLRQPDAPCAIFIGTYRSDEKEHSRFLQAWDQIQSNKSIDFDCQEIAVGPLTVEHIVDLMTSMLEIEKTETIQQRAQELYNQTNGNPLLLIELIGCFDPETNEFRSMPLIDNIRQKLTRLPNDATALLDAIAIAGQAMPLSESIEVSKINRDAMALIGRMKTERLVRQLGSDTDPRIDTYHDRIRETVLGVMDDSTKRDWHRSIAEVIERTCDALTSEQKRAIEQGTVQVVTDNLDRVFDLSYHFDMAGCASNARCYAIAAAEQSERQSSPEAAAEQFAIALRNSDGAHTELRFRCLIGLGKSLRLVGHYQEATEALDAAKNLAHRSFDIAEIAGLMAELAHKQSDIDQALILYSTALRQLGVYVPNSQIGYLVALGYQVMAQVLHTYLPSRFYNSGKDATREEELAMELANRNSIASYFNTGPRMLWTHFKGLNLAEKRKPTQSLAYSYGLHAAPIMSFGLPGRGRRYGKIALQMADDGGDESLKAHCLAMRALVAFSCGDLKESSEAGLAAINYIEKTGDFYLLTQTEFHIAMNAARTGDPTDAIQKIADAFQREISIGGCNIGALICGWTTASNGDLPFDALRSSFEIPEADKLNQIFARIGEGKFCFANGQYEQAYLAFRRAWKMTTNRVILFGVPFSSLVWMVGSLRSWAVSLDDSQTKQRNRLLREARWRIRIALPLSRIFKAERSRALREYGLLVGMKNRPQKALKILNRSLSLSDQQGDLWNRALTLREIGRLEKELDIDGADGKMEEAQSFLDHVQVEIENVKWSAN